MVSLVTSAQKGPSEAPEVVSMVQVTKRFPGVVANDAVDFSIRKGEVHALLGENGAGKSTLSSILAGLYRPDSGEIRVGGKEVVFHSPRDALEGGIGMVHQHFRLVQSFTVAENVVLGMESPGRSPMVSRTEIAERVGALASRFRLPVRPDARIWQLSVGEQQRVEILKVLYREAGILILDEPTAVLTPQESTSLFTTLRHMADDGRSVIFISHKLNEVMEVADRVTVLRKGRNVRTVATAATSPRELAALMVGKGIELARRQRQPAGSSRRAELIVKDVSALDDMGQPAVRGISFEVASGEIFGLAGVAGNGQRELVETISGLRARTQGTVEAAGRSLRASDPRHAIDAGVAYVPEDRLGTGLVPSLSVADNLVLKQYRQSPLSSGPILRRGRIRARARSMLATYDVTADPAWAVRRLSGGNLQRVMLARELSGRPKVLLAASPTRGLDVGATEFVRELLLEAVGGGMAVLLASEDLDELLDLSDRIGVMYEGRIVGIVDAEGADVEEIGLMMAGASA
jgi:simple sugar transport system ATP-binding protein